MSFAYPVSGFSAAVLVFAGFAASPAPARTDLAAPEGEVVLSVSGALAKTNAADRADFDMAMLSALPAISFTTTTNWTDGVKTFTGVPLKALLDDLGAEGATLSATALNDYSAEIPRQGLQDEAPIIAYAIDGETFDRRDKGPLWIVYPYDADAAYRSAAVYNFSVWQLRSLTVSK
jgi:hypothetical protein